MSNNLAQSSVGGRGFSLVLVEPEASSSLFDHLPNVWSQRFHFALFGSIKGALERGEGQHLENKNLPPLVEAPERSNQWAIRFPLIYLAWLDVDVNQ